jgi:hypothetical protein
MIKKMESGRLAHPPNNTSEDAETVAEIMSLTQEALNLANVAIHFDKQDNFVGAYDYYDKCILNIDEVMSKLPRTSEQWMKMMELRISYDDRLEQLKEMDKERNSMFGSSSRTSSVGESAIPMTTLTSTGGGGATPGSSSSKLLRTKLQVQEELNFVEMSLEAFVYEPPPENVPEIPFWQLRNIQRTIEDGGYITEAMFIPKRCWTQTDVKFQGLNVKTAAFDILINLINTYIDPLQMKSDEPSVIQAEESFQKVMDELSSLQNQLSKSFSYIKESKANGAANEDEASTPNSGGNEHVRESISSPPGKSWTKYVTTMGKSMKKYAEVSISRLAAAVPSKLTNEELADYTKLICELCDRSQVCLVIFSWIFDVFNHFSFFLFVDLGELVSLCQWCASKYDHNPEPCSI